MVMVSEILRQMELGNSVAETDANLQEYFLETQPYRDLIADRKDVIAGDKGTGKTALYKILQRNYMQYNELSSVEVLPAFNPTGSPVFKQLTERGVLSELQYTEMWKAYILATAGNWLLNIYTRDHSKSTRLLDDLLVGLDIRTPSDQTRTVFMKIADGIGSLFHWKKAELEFSIDPASGKYSVIPRVERAQESPTIALQPVPIEAALGVLSDCLSEVGNVAWVALDRLDEAFQGVPEVEIPALRALLRTYLDMREFSNIKIKLFIRRDLFRRIVEDQQFVNLTHINASKTDIIWNDDDLMNLLLRRLKLNKEMLSLLGRSEDPGDVFEIMFPPKVDQGDRQPKTWVWMMRRVRDGNNVKPPRNLIDLVTLARDEQLKREDRYPRDWVEGMALIEPEALKSALTQLSENRTQDTLIAEAGSYAQLIQQFEGSRAEHNEESLSALLQIPRDMIRQKIKPLVELGFLEFIRATGTYKVPALYRAGLQITQGKAFSGAGGPDDDEE
jgi:hypothetical protein